MGEKSFNLRLGSSSKEHFIKEIEGKNVEESQEMGNCGQMKEFKLKFKTDDNGRETYYEVIRGYNIVYDGGFDYYFSPNITYEHTVCLPDDCYSLHFYDEYGDGICCEHNYGKYSLYYDKKKVRSSRFRDGYKQVTNFGNCS